MEAIRRRDGDDAAADYEARTLKANANRPVPWIERPGLGRALFVRTPIRLVIISLLGAGGTAAGYAVGSVAINITRTDCSDQDAPLMGRNPETGLDQPVADSGSEAKQDIVKLAEKKNTTLEGLGDSSLPPAYMASGALPLNTAIKNSASANAMIVRPVDVFINRIGDVAYSGIVTHTFDGYKFVNAPAGTKALVQTNWRVGVFECEPGGISLFKDSHTKFAIANRTDESQINGPQLTDVERVRLPFPTLPDTQPDGATPADPINKAFWRISRNEQDANVWRSEIAEDSHPKANLVIPGHIEKATTGNWLVQPLASFDITTPKGTGVINEFGALNPQARVSRIARLAAGAEREEYWLERSGAQTRAQSDDPAIRALNNQLRNIDDLINAQVIRGKVPGLPPQGRFNPMLAFRGTDLPGEFTKGTSVEPKSNQSREGQSARPSAADRPSRGGETNRQTVTHSYTIDASGRLAPTFYDGPKGNSWSDRATARETNTGLQASNAQSAGRSLADGYGLVS